MKGKIDRKEAYQIAAAVLLISGMVLVFCFGAQIALNTKIVPFIAVTSKSMCIDSGDDCNDWNHLFGRTLHVGDMVVVQGVKPEDLETDYPDSDVIVFHKPNSPEEIVIRRIVAAETVNGTLHFYTKGDGTGSPNTWPATPQSYQYDPWVYVSQDLVEGKVVMRIPLIGHAGNLMNKVLGVGGIYMAFPVIFIFAVGFFVYEISSQSLKRRAAVVEQKPASQRTQMYL